MTDNDLADKVVALGVGGWSADGIHIWLVRGNQVLECSEFVRDWRIAGALMEMCPNGVRTCFDQLWCAQVWPATDDDDEIYADFGEVYRSNSLPRAIIEACVAALSEDGK